MNDYFMTILFLALGVGITVIQFKLTEYDPDKDF